jgi:osmotically-inducible protein OsmY
MSATPHRSDPDIFSAARKALDDHPRVPQVRAHVDRGTVTLTGNVRWPRDKSEAEAVVRRVEGVVAVVNKILVAPAVDPEGLDAPDSP